MQKELLRTLVYTDMFYLYSKSTNGHNHKWFDAWSAPLGQAVDAPVKPAKDRPLATRTFTDGLVLWLPETGQAGRNSNPSAGPLHDALTGRDVTGPLTLKPGQGAILTKALAPA